MLMPKVIDYQNDSAYISRNQTFDLKVVNSMLLPGMSLKIKKTAIHTVGHYICYLNNRFSF